MGDNFVYSKRDLILAGVTVGIIVVTLGLGFGLQKGASLPGTYIRSDTMKPKLFWIQIWW